MKLRIATLIIAILSITTLQAQFWTEDFGTGCNQNQTANGTATANGTWTVTNTGANHALANEWFISATEAGMGAGNCGDGCLATGGNNRTLHIANVAGSPAGGLLCPSGDCGSAYDATTETSKRAESPTINCTGQTTITLAFDYMVQGEVGADVCNVWYFDGAIWSTIVTPVPQTQCCGGAACGLFTQGEWAPVAYTVALPASANNNPNVKIGFEWINDNNNSGTDPSMTVDNVTLTSAVSSGPTASFGSSDSTLCIGDCINFNDLSTGSPTGWTWYFPGAATTTSTQQNPTNICYNTVGSFDVSLVVDDGSNTDSLYMPNFITVSGLPTVTANASPATTVCNGAMVTLTGGGATSYSWTGGVTDGVPFAAGATTNYIVTGTDANGCTDTSSITITVNNCSQPTASFTPDSLTICVGGDITFTDNSTGTGITTWVWDFDFTGLGGVVPATANTQGPHNVTYNTPGVYSVNLSVTDANGTDDTTIVVTVTTCSAITAGFTTSSNTICAGDSVVFTDATTGGTPTVWQWDFDLTSVGGASPSTAINQGPHTVFFNTPGSYTVELIVFDGTAFDTTSNTITVNDCSPTANFAANGSTTLCEGDSISFNDLSTGSPTSWTWSFPGGTPSTATGANPGFITYPTSGTYTVTLTVTNQYGTDSITMTNLITVNLCTAPTAGMTINDADGEICKDNCIDFIYDGGTGGTPTSLTWTFPGGTPSSYNSTDPNETISVCWNDTSGNFNVSLTVSNANGNSNANTNIVVHEPPVVNAGLDTSITIGADGYLNAVVTDTAGNVIATTGGSFAWTPTSNLINPNGQNSTVTQPIETNTYTVTYTDQYGCVVTDDVVINVDIALNIGVPSAFSPNGDGSNDFLFLRGKVVVKSMNFTIYNRYGQKVFETTDIDQGWDGTHNGKELNPGVFVYYVNVTFIDGSASQLKGNVTLVR